MVRRRDFLHVGFGVLRPIGGANGNNNMNDFYLPNMKNVALFRSQILNS